MPAPSPTYERIRLPEQHFLFVEKTCAMDGPAIAAAMGAGFGAVYSFNAAHGISPVSTPVALYPGMPEGGEMTFHAGFFLTAADAQKVPDLLAAKDASGALTLETLPPGEALRTTHVGPYAALNEAHKALWDHMATNEIVPGPVVWEDYIDDPTSTPEDTLRTQIIRMIAT
ncbi:MAG: GyrI-like domain-containing protein [Pseudomonadota bacterium]